MQASGARFSESFFLSFFRLVVDVLEVLRGLPCLLVFDEFHIEGEVSDPHEKKAQTDGDGDQERARHIGGQGHDAEDDRDQSDDQDAREDRFVLHEIPGHEGDGGSREPHEDQEHAVKHDKDPGGPVRMLQEDDAEKDVQDGVDQHREREHEEASEHEVVDRRADPGDQQDEADEPCDGADGTEGVRKADDARRSQQDADDGKEDLGSQFHRFHTVSPQK